MEKSHFLKKTLYLIKSLCALEKQVFALRRSPCLVKEVVRKKGWQIKKKTSVQSAKQDILILSFPHYFLVDQPFFPKQIFTYLLFLCSYLCKLQSAFNYTKPNIFTTWRYWSENRKSIKWDFICTLMTFQYEFLVKK